MFGKHFFVCTTLTALNSLPDVLKDTALLLTSFQKQLKTFLFTGR